jgi:hypothetical protein
MKFATLFAYISLGTLLLNVNAQAAVESYSITESYTGGTVTFDFSLDTSQTPWINGYNPNVAWYALTSVSASYTGTSLGYVPYLGYSYYMQSSNYGGYAELMLFDITDSNEAEIYFTQQFTSITAFGLDGAVDYPVSYVESTTVGGGSVINTTDVPETASMALIGTALAGLGLLRRHRIGQPIQAVRSLASNVTTARKGRANSTS